MPPSTNGESPSLDLPPPVIESGGNSADESKQLPEKQLPTIEAKTSPSAPIISNPPVQQISLPDPMSITIPSPIVATTTTNIVAPDTAEDNDLIEKEWVVKAKKIVDANREDPYSQTKEMNVFRADYMRKRYNKIIKISE